MSQDASIPCISGMNPVGEAGFPAMICPVIFLTGCNLRCPYCLNGVLVNGGDKNGKLSIHDVVSYLLDNGEESILISGGEPCIHDDGLVNLVRVLHNLRVKVRLSTNGTCPTVLAKLFDENLLSFVAMDIKTNVFDGGTKMEKLLDCFAAVPLARDLAFNIIRSLSDMTTYAKHHKTFSYEIRTTLYPPAVGEDDIAVIAKNIPSNAVWVLQQFRAKKGLLGGDEVASVVPYGDDILERMLSVAQKHAKKAFIRYP